MTWFVITLIGPLLFAITNYIDKILLEKYFKTGGIGAILIFSAFLSILILPILFYVDPTVFQVSPLHVLALATVGIINALVLFFYLKALTNEEVSVAVIFYQLVPVFAYGLGYLILGETITILQLAAMAIIILGTSIVAFEMDIENRFYLKRKTILYMLAAAFCWALGSVIFKAVALEEEVVRSLFWEHLMLTIIGIGLFTFVRSYRKQFMIAFRTNAGPLLMLNAVNESAYMAGNIVFAFAYMLAPIALVLLANSYQSIFVLLIGVFLTFFFPRTVKEKIHLKHLGQKGLAIAVTALGTYILYLSQ